MCHCWGLYSRYVAVGVQCWTTTMPGAVNPPTKIRLNREKLAAGPAEDTGSRAIGPIVQELRTVRLVPLKELLGDSVVGHEVSRVTNNDPTSVQERRIGDIDGMDSCSLPQ